MQWRLNPGGWSARPKAGCPDCQTAPEPARLLPSVRRLSLLTGCNEIPVQCQVHLTGWLRQTLLPSRSWKQIRPLTLLP